MRWIPFLNFEGILGLGSLVPDPSVQMSQLPGSWSHFYTMLREKEAHEISETWFLFWWNVLSSSRFAQLSFPGTFIDSHFSDIYRSLDERFSMNVDPCP